MNEKIEELSNILRGSNNIVFFGGAGVSTVMLYKFQSKTLDAVPSKKRKR